jgi:hypothetical protein
MVQSIQGTWLINQKGQVEKFERAFKILGKSRES